MIFLLCFMLNCLKRVLRGLIIVFITLFYGFLFFFNRWVFDFHELSRRILLRSILWKIYIEKLVLYLEIQFFVFFLKILKLFFQISLWWEELFLGTFLILIVYMCLEWLRTWHPADIYSIIGDHWREIFFTKIGISDRGIST